MLAQGLDFCTSSFLVDILRICDSIKLDCGLLASGTIFEDIKILITSTKLALECYIISFNSINNLIGRIFFPFLSFFWGEGDRINWGGGNFWI